MAQLNVTVDTESGKLDISLNGKKLANVTEIMCTNYGDMPRFSVMTHEEDEDVIKMSHISANFKDIQEINETKAKLVEQLKDQPLWK